MHTTNELLDAVSKRYGGATDYRLSKLLRTSTQTVNHWRKGRAILSQEFAVRVADALDWPHAYVIACAEHERAQRALDAGRDPLAETWTVLRTWEAIAKAFRPKTAAGVLLACAAAWTLSALPSQADAASAAGVVRNNVYYG